MSDTGERIGWLRDRVVVLEARIAELEDDCKARLSIMSNRCEKAISELERERDVIAAQTRFQEQRADNAEDERDLLTERISRALTAIREGGVYAADKAITALEARDADVRLWQEQRKGAQR